ncbi:hypothetical protein L210DRAFT_3121702 [Boletus edulis BED1]|uniref:Uncharacterized protein n=1 Tax=Boletus edulis BED1 TaxID=1328754 RepID=A0AAD4BH56_BOLED|nr:hypothetical protein L210DRAFT_3121702 [Boletus edulis BED1]
MHTRCSAWITALHARCEKMHSCAFKGNGLCPAEYLLHSRSRRMLGNLVDDPSRVRHAPTFSCKLPCAFSRLTSQVLLPNILLFTGRFRGCEKYKHGDGEEDATAKEVMWQAICKPCQCTSMTQVKKINRHT